MLYQIVLFIILQSIVQSEDCKVQGKINTDQTWYGFIGIGRFKHNTSRFQYTFKFSSSSSPINVLLYFDDQIKALQYRDTCSGKEAILKPENNQIIHLTTNSIWSGCKAGTDDNTGMIICKGARILRSHRPRTWHIAVSSCNSPSGINMEYNLTFVNHLDGNCDPNTTGGSITVFKTLKWLFSLVFME